MNRRRDYDYEESTDEESDDYSEAADYRDHHHPSDNRHHSEDESDSQGENYSYGRQAKQRGAGAAYLPKNENFHEPRRNVRVDRRQREPEHRERMPPPPRRRDPVYERDVDYTEDLDSSRVRQQGKYGQQRAGRNRRRDNEYDMAYPTEPEPSMFDQDHDFDDYPRRHAEQPRRNLTQRAERNRPERERQIRNPREAEIREDRDIAYEEDFSPFNQRRQGRFERGPGYQEQWNMPPRVVPDFEGSFDPTYLEQAERYADRRVPLARDLKQGVNNRGRVRISAEDLVSILTKERDFRASLLYLHETHNLQLAYLRSVIATNSHVFRTSGESVELRINVKICSAHNGPSGCANRTSCQDLHLCSKYTENKCKNENCIMGHRWLTNRNTKIMEGFKLTGILQETMEKIMMLSVTSSSNSQLDVCLKYNNKGCRRPNCPKLHVCYEFVKGLSQCSRQNCQLNHDLLTSDCCRLLEAAGIDVNESPRDVLVSLLDANPSLKKRAENREISDQQVPVSASDNDDDSSQEKRVRKPKPKKIRTVWVYEPKGDADISEICYDSVEGICSNERAGCRRLHALEHYHWQVSENGKTWLNLQPHQVKSLELSFCNVDNDDCDLPRFDPLQSLRFENVLISMLGRDTWLADFKTMTMTDSKKQRKLQIRRLCTEIISGKTVKANSFIWHFKDKQQNWVKYGEVDTVGAKDLVSSCTSQDIEKEYLKGSSTMTFQNAQFTYILDFGKMTQTNQKTNVVREVRRRPEAHLENEEEEETEKQQQIPAEWETMQPGERLKRVVIPQTSDEYKKAVQLLGNTISNNVTKLERVQNRFHWFAFQNKVEEINSIYGDETKSDIRQLFHGTNPDVVPKICSENFDPRLHGISTGQLYGQGTYFATDADMSYRYCRADANGQKFMFIAQVAVGAFTKGDAKMARPPINSATGAPYDSTVDDVTTPKIIVKYDKAEYYPQYIFTLK